MYKKRRLSTLTLWITAVKVKFWTHKNTSCQLPETTVYRDWAELRNMYVTFIHLLRFFYRKHALP